MASNLPSSSIAPGSRIRLCVSNQRAYVWDVDGMSTLHMIEHLLTVREQILQLYEPIITFVASLQGHCRT
jgi:hypothetical protein